MDPSSFYKICSLSHSKISKHELNRNTKLWKATINHEDIYILTFSGVHSTGFKNVKVPCEARATACHSI